MNLNRAQYILTILEEGSISAAAHKLYISQAALSQAVRCVEKEVGLPVLERGRGVVKLTYAGQRYVETVKQMMLLERSFRNEIDEIKREKSGQFRVGVTTRNGQVILPSILPGFLEEYPSVKFQLTEGSSAELTHMVQKGDLDVAMVRTSEFARGVVYQLLKKEQLGILAGKGSRLYQAVADGTWIDISQAVQDRMVFTKKGHSSRASQDRLLKAYQLEVQPMMELDNFETATQVVMNCGAVMLAPFSALRSEQEIAEKGHFYPLKGAEQDGDTYLIYNEAVYLTPYMKRWMELVKEFYQEI